MAYETGVSTSPSNLLSKIWSHATVSPGLWTAVRNNGAPGGQASFYDGTASEANQFNFIADDTAATASISGQPSRADGGALDLYYEHPGTPVSGPVARTVRMGHPTSGDNQGFGGSHVAYHIFSGSTSDGLYMHVVCEGDAGVFFHLMFGTIEKAGTFSGGQYMSAMQTYDNSGQVCWPFELNPGNWHSTQWLRCDDVLTTGSITTDSTPWPPGARWTENFGSTRFATGLPNAWMSGGVIQWNQRTPFAPNLTMIWEDLVPAPGTDDFVILGHTPDLRIVSMDGRTPGEVVTIGSDDWHLFPVHVKVAGGAAGSSNSYLNTYVGGGPPDNHSNIAGLAFLEN